MKGIDLSLSINSLLQHLIEILGVQKNDKTIHVRMCLWLKCRKGPLFTVAESGRNGSDALDHRIIHHLLGRRGQGETGDSQAIPADDKKSSRSQRLISKILCNRLLRNCRSVRKH